MAVKKTRNAGTMTEAAYFGMLRSGLRRTCRYWRPIVNARNAARRKYTGENKRQKWEFLCSACKGWYKQSEVEVNHKVPCGSLRSLDDLAGFVERLTAESDDAYEVVCKPCHKAIGKKERKKK